MLSSDSNFFKVIFYDYQSCVKANKFSKIKMCILAVKSICKKQINKTFKPIYLFNTQNNVPTKFFSKYKFCYSYNFDLSKIYSY